MALAAAARGLQYFAVTDHSRSSKLQGGLTPLFVVATSERTDSRNAGLPRYAWH